MVGQAPVVTAEAAPYDVDRIRADFPILAVRPYGKPLVYLDNAASAQKTAGGDRPHFACLCDRIRKRASRACTSSPMRRRTPSSMRASRCGVFLNAGSVDEIVFTRSATESINLVAASFGQAHIGGGDEIVLSIMEHHSNIVPWHFLRERKGRGAGSGSMSTTTAPSHIEAFERALTERTKIVAITHMSNMLGTVTPIKEIVRIAHARGIPVLVDGSQGAVHLDVDVRDLDADFYVFTGHKVYGPDRHRRALRQARDAGFAAALQTVAAR